MRTLSARLAVISVAICALNAAPSWAQGPNPAAVYIEGITSDGSGCPQGSVGQSINGTRSGFTLIFDSFVASAAPGVPTSEAKKDCEIVVTLHVPTGFRGGEFRFDYRGYRQLPAGELTLLKRKYQPSKAAGTASALGEVAADYLVSDQVAFTKIKSCDGTPCLVLKIKSSIARLTDGPSQATVDSIDGAVTVSAAN